MATVVITFFLFVQFSVCAMDAEEIESPRESLLVRREKRWSMNSQRLEAIVAQLMKPISSDNRRSFDTDQSAISIYRKYIGHSVQYAYLHFDPRQFSTIVSRDWSYKRH